jgi:hypothetical protein
MRITVSTESTEPTRTTDLAAAALTAMADAAAAIERVLPGLLAAAHTLPALLAVRVKATSYGPEINLQPRTVTDTHAWAAYLGCTVTIKDSHTDYSTGPSYRRGATAEIEYDGVRVHIGSCTFYSPDEWAKLQAAEAIERELDELRAHARRHLAERGQAPSPQHWDQWHEFLDIDPDLRDRDYTQTVGAR